MIIQLEIESQYVMQTLDECFQGHFLKKLSFKLWCIHSHLNLECPKSELCTSMPERDSFCFLGSMHLLCCSPSKHKPGSRCFCSLIVSSLAYKGKWQGKAEHVLV